MVRALEAGKRRLAGDTARGGDERRGQGSASGSPGADLLARMGRRKMRRDPLSETIVATPSFPIRDENRKAISRNRRTRVDERGVICVQCRLPAISAVQ
jgi:hypothetical protein